VSSFRIQLPDDAVHDLVELVAARVLERLGEPPPPSPFVTTGEAARYLACSRQRVFDLLSASKLSRFKEGTRTLLLRSELEALVQLQRRAR
jgi:excisionase family DNA binding protein